MGLSRLTLKKIEQQVRCSPEGMTDDLFRDTIDNLQLASAFSYRETRVSPVARWRTGW